MTDGRLTFTTSVRVVAGVHDRTTDSRSDAEVAGLTCLAKLDILVLKVADLTDRCLAIEAKLSHFA